MTTGLEQILNHDTDAPALLIETPSPSGMTDDRATEFRRHATRGAPHLSFLEPRARRRSDWPALTIRRAISGRS